MKKVIVYISGVVFFLSICLGIAVYVTPPPPTPPDIIKPPPIQGASAALLWTNKNKIIAEKNGDSAIYPASTTKILTCIIALEEGHTLLKKEANISSFSIKQDGTLLGISPDNPIILEQLLYGMMLVSGNDAASAVAETVGGEYHRFIQMMNEKANIIGCTNSHFSNASGLTDPAHYSTAVDMTKIAAYAMNNQMFRDIVSKKIYNMTYVDGTVQLIKNRNEFLDSKYYGANGIKTGMTEAAGECLVASAERNGQLLIMSVYNDEARWQDVQKWLNYGFSIIEQEEKYQKELAEEPRIYKWINQLLGKELYEEKTSTL
ncbi:D-alanyl-D-alanine carboxypeptidase family protein [Dialister pneumosintes]|jgi:D-alanyl-D-alanine carboxypeptidase|uniref:D-alanyl-D-alanine carboxypeptidase n=1 Tax=Dialister pneumosintes TaxID=39950 RepID=A0ABX9MB52_9FIRM|nr:serine hydrolase [Dialister pneumosintes]MBS6480106.1 D-alanyl-D-alanine carboxypeptidase [Dialister sp.]RID94846.1 D-alanyl-D-alanine carboxypeptidase [Dialister pneumosintes]